MASRSLSDLHPWLAERARQHVELCAASGVRLVVYCTYRSDAEQRALYAQGRQVLDITNRMRAEAGLPPITAEENARKVTQRRTGSNHGHTQDGKPCALAYDAAPLDDTGHMDWSGSSYRWHIVIDVGRRLGLVWGGDWNMRDLPHWEMPGKIK